MFNIGVEIKNWCLNYDYTFVNSLIPWMICKKMEGKWVLLRTIWLLLYKDEFCEIGRHGWMNHGFLLI